MTLTVHSALRGSPAMLAVLDANLVCHSLSDGWRQYLDLPLKGELALPVTALFLIDENQSLLGELHAVVTFGQPCGALPVSLRDAGGVHEGLLWAWPVKDHGGDPALMISATCSETLDNALSELGLLRKQYQVILDAAGEGVYGLDGNGRITFGNAATREILGWRPDDVLGEQAHAVHHHSHADGTPYPRERCPIYAALTDGEVHRVASEVFWHTDGSAVPVEYTSTPILEDGKPNGAVVVFRDVSERLRGERQREAHYAEIAELKDQLERERDYLRDEINVNANFGEIIGESQALKRALSQIEAVAATPASVLVLGESGVGKEMIARAIHMRSERADKALVKVNCASIPHELFESEFFGHVKGAFTGAHRDRIGRLQLAHGGTLFLDEIGEIPLDQQVKLLRALQEHEFERVGDDETVKVDVRVVAATNRDLVAEIAAGRFREDLYYRLSVFPVEIPPLRERSADIPPLALHFLAKTCKELGREPMHLSRRQVDTLTKHNWPGNVRELQNVIERAVILSDGRRLRLEAALPGDATPPSMDAVLPSEPGQYLTESEFRDKEKANVVAALEAAEWKVWGPGGAAELLEIKPSTLTYRIKNLGIVRPDRGMWARRAD